MSGGRSVCGLDIEPADQNGSMLIEHAGNQPLVHAEAYVAPTAVLSGDVKVGPHVRVLFGAVLSDDGGSVEIGERCVVMEHAVLRGTPRHPVRLGRNVLIGPHAYVSGAVLEDDVFVATGGMVFNGARMEHASSVALGGAVHIGCRVPPETRIPIGWVAVGEPARILPPDEVDEIRRGLDDQGGFFHFVFGTDPSLDRTETMRIALDRYSRGLASHRDDRIID
jgi:carbonic anhydrase/acetyltransferase-like protein (isoleucine patch superfamily)